MMPFRPVFVASLIVSAFLLVASGPANAQERDGLGGFSESGRITLSPSVKQEIESDLLTPAQRNQMAIFHGQWSKVKDPSPADQARLALARYELSNAALANEAAPVLVRAQAAMLRGDVKMAADLVKDDASMQASVLRAAVYEQLGEFDKAVALLGPMREKLQFENVENAADLTAATRGLLMLARLEGRPSQDYQLAKDLFKKVRDELDHFYWPARVEEGKLFISKGNSKDGQAALAEALRLNPGCAPAWQVLGEHAVNTFDFARAQYCINQIRKNNSDHPLASIVEAHLLLKQGDGKAALAVIDKRLKDYPRQPDLLGLRVAATALTYDEEKFDKALADYAAVAPRGADAYFIAGRYLALHRQYEQAEKMLRTTLERQPNWPAARVELGLLLMQSGDEKAARDELRIATRLDGFHIRAGNQLKLVEELLTYDTIQTDHFVMKFKPGIDEVLARDMAFTLGNVYDHVTKKYQHQPRRKTFIEIMPNTEWFAVRITGMPDIWTVAASTGDVVSLTPPRPGLKQAGPFYWYNVIQHEFAHTVTLDKTNNRLPHWFTEACAVDCELTGRTYDTCKSLAMALRREELFTLDNINWAFIRPAKPTDRPLAYAQAHWMLEYIAETHGANAVIDMLEMFAEGASDVEAIQKITGNGAEAFMSSFKEWAKQEVLAWGLGPQATIREIPAGAEEVRGLTDARLAELLEEHPDHPDVLKVAAARQIKKDSDLHAARQAVLLYVAARPVDPWSYRQLVTISARAGQTDEVLTALAQLDKQADKTGRWAYELAKMLRKADRLEEADAAALRSLYREPYNGTYRELAAALDLQQGQADDALHHLVTLTKLEPQRALHHIRAAALYYKLDNKDEAHNAAERALKINPDAPVQKFMKKTEEGKEGEAGDNKDDAGKEDDAGTGDA